MVLTFLIISILIFLISLILKNNCYAVEVSYNRDDVKDIKIGDKLKLSLYIYIITIIGFVLPILNVMISLAFLFLIITKTHEESYPIRYEIRFGEKHIISRIGRVFNKKI